MKFMCLACGNVNHSTKGDIYLPTYTGRIFLDDGPKAVSCFGLCAKCRNKITKKEGEKKRVSNKKKA